MQTKESRRAYYLKNAERLKQEARDRYYKNPEKVKENVLQWQRNNPDKVASYKHKKWVSNPEPIKKRSKEWYIANSKRAKGNLLKRQYGINLEQYNVLLESQNHKCKICKLECYSGTLSVDHDHKTGHVRGLLCRKCNAALGMLNEDISVLMAAIDYLTLPRE